jgi:endonuclease/exonuclease/phosphatase (EEP) superfamily protein YafD
MIGVLTGNLHFEKVKNIIKNSDVDILLLNEINYKWLEELNEVVTDFDIKEEYPREDNFGIALYSKINDSNQSVKVINLYEIPYIKYNFTLNNTDFSLYYIHLIPPLPERNFHVRNMQLENIMEKIKNDENNIILAGDFNMTTFSRYYRNLLKQTNLNDSRKGFGIQRSWPVNAPAFSIDIDHFFISENLKVKTRKLLEFVGSDHYPVYVEIIF